MITMTKTIEVGDYADVNGLKEPLQEMAHTLTQRGWRIEVGHHHRMWEYGRALLALTSQFREQTDKCRVLEVGAGWSVLGPTLAHYYGCDVTECEPNAQAYADRQVMIPLLNRRGKFRTLNVGVEQLPEEQYDAVFCISVLEHVSAETERWAWLELGRRVKDHGILFVTVDCAKTATDRCLNDEHRCTRYTPSVIKERVGALSAVGFVPMGPPDYAYHGHQVYDYTFMSVGMIKGELSR